MQTSIKSIDIILNGAGYTLDTPATLAALVSVRKPTSPFAIEVNKKLVRRTEYDAVTLNAGDRVEIVTLVGGG
jgi:thiamine biosynthesis protein ThiS